MSSDLGGSQLMEREDGLKCLESPTWLGVMCREQGCRSGWSPSAAQAPGLNNAWKPWGSCGGPLSAVSGV